MNPGQARKVEQLDSVAWVGLFHPAYKLDPATAQAIGKVADAVVIGSRIIQLLEDQPHEKIVPVAVDFLRGVRKALDA